MPTTTVVDLELASGTTADTGNPALDIQVVIPAFNEERRIKRSLLALCKRLGAMEHLRCGIIVIDNGSSDRTVELVDLFADHPVAVTVIGCSTGGKGAAIRRGIQVSTARFVGFCDADLATPVEALDDAVRLLEMGHCVVVGSRRAAGATYTVPQSRLRRAGGWVFRRSIRTLTGAVTDTQCGFKFFEQSVAKQLFGEVITAGFVFDVELLARASMAGIEVTELPVKWSDQEGSTLSVFRHGPQIAREIRQLRHLGLTAASCAGGVRRAAVQPVSTVRQTPGRPVEAS